MYSISLNPEARNVPDSREHIDSISICSHKVGTFSNRLAPWVIYTKGITTILQINGTYRYHDHTFKILDGRLHFENNNIKLPTRTSISTLERLMLGLGMPISPDDINATLDMTRLSARSILSHMTSMALKDRGIISNNLSWAKQIKYGEVIFDVYLLSLWGSGRIKAIQPSMRWLNEADTLQLKSRLFNTSDHEQEVVKKNYQVGVHSMKYTPTEFADSIFDTALTLLLSMDFKENEIKFEPLDFVVRIELLKEIRLRDVMLLLNNCIGYSNGFIIRPELTDEQYSRVYSVFTSIGSTTRKLLGFINYDIGAALQTICLQLVADTAKYPHHQELVSHKHAFRAKVMAESDKDLDWVKKELTSADNRDKMPKYYTSIPTLKAYFEEALSLRKEIINSAEPIILSRATDFAKTKWNKVWDDNTKTFEYIADEKKESSIFFFIWTQWERQLREEIMGCFDTPESCHQVHDAVYSKQAVDLKFIEKKVLELTGFRVNISND